MTKKLPRWTAAILRARRGRRTGPKTTHDLSDPDTKARYGRYFGLLVHVSTSDR